MATQPLAGELQQAAVYERSVPVSIERVWENVHDWEHLPWLHSSAFSAIELEESGAWGWRARIATPGSAPKDSMLIELRLEDDAPRYHTRTLEGTGAGGDIVTTLEARGDSETGIRVEFWIPEADPERARAVGKLMVGLYTKLWDEDESMMVERQAFLDRRRPEHAADASVDLGLLDPSGDRVIETDHGRYRIVPLGDRWFAVETTCPHLGGPLQDALLRDGHLICPWHGYRFSVETGRNPDGRPCRLPTPLPVEVLANGHGRLHWGGQSS